MIKHVISNTSPFTGCLEFIFESSLSFAGPDVYHLRYPIYLFFSSLRVMPIVPTVLHWHVVHDDDITRKLAYCG